MAGINLSQSMQEGRQGSKKGSLFDKGLVGSFVIFLVVTGFWGWLEWQTRDINNQIATMDAAIADSATRLAGKNFDRVADFADRTILISQDAVMVDSQALLTELEGSMVPEIILTKYDYNREDGKIIVAGTTDNFKFLAQQILALKKKSTFSDIRVATIDRSKEGKIAFELETPLPSIAK